MRILFQPLRECPDLRTVLRADGWSLEGARDDAVLAEHPGVADEDAARSRLHRLDLLTSAGLRIEFLPGLASSGAAAPFISRGRGPGCP